MDDIKKEYIEVSKKESNYLFLGVLASSLVFIVPFIIIILNGWWKPLGTATDGWRWVGTSVVLLSLIYLSLLFDRIYRQH